MSFIKECFLHFYQLKTFVKQIERVKHEIMLTGNSRLKSMSKLMTKVCQIHVTTYKKSFSSQMLKSLRLLQFEFFILHYPMSPWNE